LRKLSIVFFLVYIFGSLTAYLPAVPHAEVKELHGHPTLYIDETPYPPFAYMSYLGETRYYREAAEAGIHLYCFPAYLGNRGINSTSRIGPFRPAIWIEENKFDYSSIKIDFAKILKADPQAEVIIRIHLDVPQWWDDRNPGECTLLPDGTSQRQNFSSELWRKQAGEALAGCVRWLIESPYSGHLAGIHVAAGFTEEWFYHFSGSFADINPLRVRSFQAWLSEQYQNNPQALQESWGSNQLTFENAVPADISGILKQDEWRDPSGNQDVIDTFRFHAETMADNIAYFCGIVKESSNRKLLTGAFYGYHFYVTDPRRGHGALGKLLECPDLDYLSSPNVYNRVMGEDWPPMAAVQSVQLHGKLWMAENDTRTSITTLLKDRAPEICPPGQYQSGVWLGPPDIKSSEALLWKNSARMLAYGYGGWWFDMWGGWFSDPVLLNVLKTTGKLYRQYPPQKENLMAPQVCILTDEELQYLDAGFGSLCENILSNRYALGKTGAPYDLYLRSDSKILPVTSYRVIWLLGIPSLTDKESLKIQDWIDSGIVVLWTSLKGTIIYQDSKKSSFYQDRFTWSPAELRKLWQDSGVHLYLDTDDVLYAGRGWLSIHSARGGNKVAKLPFHAKITDPLTGETVATSAKSFNTQLEPGSTRLFRIEPVVKK